MTVIPQPTALDHRTPGHSGVHEHAHDEISFVKKYVFSTDHKVIGLQFLFLGLIFMVIGGMEAMLVRWQLGWPGADVPLLGKYMAATGAWSDGKMPPDFYNAAFTMHASLMIFFVIIPLLVGTFGNYLIPLQIGARDMAFPFLNGFALWLAVPAGAIMLAGFFLQGGPPIAGWTSYPPISALWLPGASPGAQWPLISVVMNFAALFMCFMYVCAYSIRLGIRPLNWIVSIVVSAGLAVVANWGVQKVVFDGQSAWFFSLFLAGFANIMGAVNYLATIIKLRCPGMTMFRLPLAVWSLFITSILVLLATPVLASLLLMNLLEHHRFTSFFLSTHWIENNAVSGVAGGGYPLLHQHLFWFYSHPAVYIMILPAMGMVSDILAAFSRKPVFGYRPMVYALAGIAFLGFVVWAHHMFQSGMQPTMATGFAIATMFIAVPSAIKVFNWLGTIWGGNIRFTAAMLCALGFVSQFVVGGLSGIFMASTAVDVHIHDTYFIVAHIHYVLFGSSLFGIFAAIYFWYPKMFGRMMSEKLGVLHFWLTFVFFNLTFFPMHILGLSGFPRRVAEYLHYQTYNQYQPMNQFISVAAFALGVSQIPFVINFIGAWFWGKRASANPWLATTLEWETPSPPPHGNFAKPPVVHHGPYEYASPLVEEDWLAQTRWVDGPAALAAAKH